MEWYLRVLKKYAVFNGRAGRREYWMFTLWSLVFIIALAIADHALDIDTIKVTNAGSNDVRVGPLMLGYLAATLLPNLAVQCRRLHDLGRTGWIQLVTLVPYLGTAIMIFFAAQPGQTGPNKYGPDPNFSRDAL